MLRELAKGNVSAPATGGGALSINLVPEAASTAASWHPTDQEAIRQALALPATVPCLEAIGRAMADLQRQHPAGVLSARALLDAVAVIDQQLQQGGCVQEQAIQKSSRSGPIAGSVAAAGEAPLQKADVIEYDTALLREEIETVYANPASIAAALRCQRQGYVDQIVLLLPALASWVAFTTTTAAAGTISLLRG